MLLVIFGAGASYDSSRAFPPIAPRAANQNFGTPPPPPDEGEAWRPPLAAELFHDNKQRFGEIVARYPRLHPILGRLREPLNGRSVEEELQSLQDEAEAYPEGKRQLLSVRYYLRDLLAEVTENWLKRTRLTNYAPLIDQILRFRTDSESVCLVTFNYDVLLDRALTSFGYNPQSLDHYFDAHPTLKLFKPHGSVDWARFVDAPPDSRFGPPQLIEQADTIKLSDDYLVSNATDPHQLYKYNRPILPAIAIPVQTKSEDTFEWPPRHRAYLEELLPSVTKILIIGWQAREAHFLQMLREKLPMGGRRVAHILVVGKNSADAKATLHFFASELGQSGYNQSHSYANAGFSQFVANREGEAFLRA